MSFNKKTTVTQNTGLGDDQYAQLQTNQGNIDENLQSGFGAVGTRLNTVDSGISGLATDIGNVNTNTNTGFTNIQDLLGEYNSGMNTQFSKANDRQNSIIAGQGDLNRVIGQQGIANTAGQTRLYDDLSGRFDTVDADVGSVQGSVDQGFVDQAQGFSDAQDDRTTRFDAAGEAISTGFSDAGTAIEGVGDQLTQTQSNVLGGQGELQSSLNTMSSAADINSAASLERQDNLQAGQDAFKSSFDTYVDRYTEDTTLANQTRTDMQTANANANSKLREDIGGFAQAAATGQQDLSKQVGQVDNSLASLGSTVEGGFVASEAATMAASDRSVSATSEAEAALNSQFATGLSGLDAGQVTAARDMAKIASAQTDLDMSMRQDFNQLGNAFDESGKLIESSIDEQGNSITRAMDEQGNLLLNSFDVTGKAIGSKVLNMRSTLQNLSDLNTKQGANASMGNLSPAMSSNVPQGGFASPFASTG